MQGGSLEQPNPPPMPAWITLVATDLHDYLLAEQVTALRTEALAAGQADPFGAVAPDLIRKVRMYIASNPANTVDASELTLPPELKTDVCYLILGPLLGRLGIALTKDQETAIERAHSTLVGLRDGKLTVSKPTTPVLPDVQATTGVEQASPGRRQVSRDDLNSL